MRLIALLCTAHVHVDDEMNARVFGRRVNALDILAGKVPPPERFVELIATLESEADPPPPIDMPPRPPSSGFQVGSHATTYTS